jgi:sugar phosphate isomerase/epimerase
LQPKDTADLVAAVKNLGLSHVQLQLLPLITADDKRKHQELGHWRNSGLKLTGTMMNFPGEDYATIARIRETGGWVPDADWPVRKRLTEQGAKLTAELGASSLLAHVGFVPHKGGPGYQKIVDRIREIADILGKQGVTLIMETGQEPVAELLGFLHDLKATNVAINFDPANMILYGAGDPIEAIKTLGKNIRHVHVKDATASVKPGVDWGEEVPFGTGQVGPQRFLDALESVGYRGPLAIEREAGNQRGADIKTAADVLQGLK